MAATYKTFEVLIGFCDSAKHVEVVACDMNAAHADLRAAYGDDLDIISTRVL